MLNVKIGNRTWNKGGHRARKGETTERRLASIRPATATCTPCQPVRRPATAPTPPQPGERQLDHHHLHPIWREVEPLCVRCRATSRSSMDFRSGTEIMALLECPSRCGSACRCSGNPLVAKQRCLPYPAATQHATVRWQPHEGCAGTRFVSCRRAQLYMALTRCQNSSALAKEAEAAEVIMCGGTDHLERRCPCGRHDARPDSSQSSLRLHVQMWPLSVP